MQKNNSVNPFDNKLAIANSNYMAFIDDKLTCIGKDSTNEPTPLAEFVHSQFRSLVCNPNFSCVGAKSAIHRGNYRFGLYNEIGSAESSLGLARDLFQFVQEQHQLEGFKTFVTCFENPSGLSEPEFEKLLWQQLQRLHDLDYPHHSWDASVSSDPVNPQFSFSFGGSAFFIVGMHAASSRWTRRFAWPTLIFNLHYQFEQLREEGKFERVQSTIRTREHNLQGDLNPNLSNYGELSEARQYAGSPVDSEWQCPLHIHSVDTEKHTEK